jgi:hypothetical protein
LCHGYFEIKRLHIERLDIEGKDLAMTGHPFPATPWEVEAERRREVIESDAMAGRPIREAAPGSLAVSRDRHRLAWLRGSTDAPPAHAGRLNQKRV